MPNTKKKTKTTRITKMERLRIEAEKTRPLDVSILTASGKCEVEITMLYNSTMHNRMAGIRADYYVGDPDDTAAPTVYMDNPQDLRILAQALLAAADWMEDGK